MISLGITVSRHAVYPEAAKLARKDISCRVNDLELQASLPEQ
jgi:hypothetical protein